jgi:hypothetical protein
MPSSLSRSLHRGDAQSRTTTTSHPTPPANAPKSSSTMAAGSRQAPPDPAGVSAGGGAGAVGPVPLLGRDLVERVVQLGTGLGDMRLDLGDQFAPARARRADQRVAEVVEVVGDDVVGDGRHVRHAVLPARRWSTAALNACHWETKRSSASSPASVSA